jgi:hypothetical protein
VYERGGCSEGTVIAQPDDTLTSLALALDIHLPHLQVAPRRLLVGFVWCLLRALGVVRCALRHSLRGLWLRGSRGRTGAQPTPPERGPRATRRKPRAPAVSVRRGTDTTLSRSFPTLGAHLKLLHLGYGVSRVERPLGGGEQGAAHGAEHANMNYSALRC